MREYLGAVATLEAVIRDGQHLDDAKGSDAFATEIAYGVVRHYYQLSEALERLMEKPLPDKHLNLRLLLLAGLYAIGHLHRPVHASVNAAVSATEPLGKPWAKGLVNGVLRNALRGKKNSDSALSADGSSLSADGSSLNAEGSLSSTESSSIEAQLNHPSWLIDELKAAWPDQDLFAANNARAPMVLRVNLTRTSRAAFVATLKQAGIGAAPGCLSNAAVVLEQPMPVKDVPGFSDGLCSVQDEAPQLAAGLLNLAAGQLVLDACAAPGGKTCHLLETCPGILLTAMDSDAKRLKLVTENLARLGLDCTTICTSLLGYTQATQPANPAQPTGATKSASPDNLTNPATPPDPANHQAPGFDRILLDAPCSATGVIRRHPDIKLLRQPADIDKLCTTQGLLLTKAFKLLNPGGELVYATCSVLPSENDQVVKAFLSQEATARLLPVDLPAPAIATETGMQLLPNASWDGFFYARLGKLP